MSAKLRLAPLIGLIVSGALLLTGCSGIKLGRTAEATPSASPATTAATADPSPAATTPPATEPPSDGQAGIEDSDGTLAVLPMVTGGGEVLPTADTTNDVRTPATYKDALKCGPVQNWQELVDCVGGLQWYIDGVNAHKGKTGFDWNDVIKWAKDTKDYDTRAIVVYNSPGLSEQDARTRAKDVVGNGNEDKLPVVYKNTCIINTRGFGHEQMQDFVDCRKMVRVSLVPIAYGTDGKPGFPANLSESLKSGVFVDCFNLWWLPKKVVPGGPPPSTPTPTPTPPNGKDPKDDVTPPNGVTQLPVGKKTDGKQSGDQKQSGDTSGNVTDKPVDEDTKSGDTMSDPGKGSDAPGASSGGDDSSKAANDDKNTNQDDGGTGGDTEISDPDD